MSFLCDLDYLCLLCDLDYLCLDGLVYFDHTFLPCVLLDSANGRHWQEMRKWWRGRSEYYPLCSCPAGPCVFPSNATAAVGSRSLPERNPATESQGPTCISFLGCHNKIPHCAMQNAHLLDKILKEKQGCTLYMGMMTTCDRLLCMIHGKIWYHDLACLKQKLISWKLFWKTDVRNQDIRRAMLLLKLKERIFSCLLSLLIGSGNPHFSLASIYLQHHMVFSLCLYNYACLHKAIFL